MIEGEEIVLTEMIEEYIVRDVGIVENQDILLGNVKKEKEVQVETSWWRREDVLNVEKKVIRREIAQGVVEEEATAVAKVQEGLHQDQEVDLEADLEVDLEAPLMTQEGKGEVEEKNIISLEAAAMQTRENIDGVIQRVQEVNQEIEEKGVLVKTQKEA